MEAQEIKKDRNEGMKEERKKGRKKVKEAWEIKKDRNKGRKK